MLFCPRCIQLFFLIPVIYSRGDTVEGNATISSTIPQKQDETIFTNVIRNISRVNNFLQDLIDNYVKIEKVFEPNSFEKDLSSDIEIDELYKNKKLNNKSKSRTYVENTISPKKEFPATAMIFSDGDVSEIEDSVEDNKEVKRAESDQKYAVDEDSDDNSKESSHPKALLEKTSIAKKIAIDKSKIILSTNQKHIKDKDGKEKGLNHKTHYKQELKHKITSTPTKSNKRNVKKVIYVESFPQGKIWDEIAHKKPINLRSINIPSPRLKIDKIHFRSNRSPKTALVIVTKNNNYKRDPIKIPSYLEHVFSSDETNTKLIQANILRHAYGEACLRMVVKKCYKACKETKKIACRKATCKNSFKEKFMDWAKTGCIKEFKPYLMNKTHATFLKKYKEGSDFADSSGEDGGFTDATRNGFPVETCYPFMVQEANTDSKDSNKTTTPLDAKKKVLRDRYERACERASSDKCNQACLFAYKHTCETYECSKSKKKAFRKHCKRQCKKAFKFKDWNQKKSSSSSSSSTTSSSSSSDSDSDFDTEDFE